MTDSNPVRFGTPVDPKCEKCGRPVKDGCPHVKKPDS